MATSGTMNPLPSLIRASAQDAANARMRKANRSAWTRADYNAACAMQTRLIRACYGRKGEPSNSRLPFLRFQIAEQMQREGLFGLDSDFNTISATIDEVIAA